MKLKALFINGSPNKDGNTAKLAFAFQGASPEKWMLDAGNYTMSRFAGLYGMEYSGMATTLSEAKSLGKKLFS